MAVAIDTSVKEEAWCLEARGGSRVKASDPAFWSAMAVANFDMGLSSAAYEPETGKQACESEEPRMEEAPVKNLPFPADISLQVDGIEVPVCHDFCQPNSELVSGIALFLPGFAGGVGPGRRPGMDFDNDGLFPSVARMLTGTLRAPVDCYRMSWGTAKASPVTAASVALNVLKHAASKACRFVPSNRKHEFRVFLIGHSFGGEAAILTALELSRLLSSGEGKQFLGHRRPLQTISMAGVCTLNASGGRFLQPQAEELMQSFEPMSSVRTLVVAGDADLVMRPDVSLMLHLALPSSNSRDREFLLLPGGTHDLYRHKRELERKVCRFVTDGLKM